MYIAAEQQWVKNEEEQEKANSLKKKTAYLGVSVIDKECMAERISIWQTGVCENQVADSARKYQCMPAQGGSKE